jgi:hypothetical protein
MEMRQLRTRPFRLRFFLVVAATSLITLAASNPIYSAVSGSHVTGHTSASPVATAGPTVSGPCSRAVANRLLKQLHLGPNWPEPNPAAQVLCGAFTGPRSRAMAVTFRLGICMPTLGWGVFRLTAGKWKLVMTQNGYSTLAAVGTDIRETAPIYRQGDGRCFPSGGTRARVWHWNGTRLVAGPWKVTSTGPKTVHLDTFNSPDRKVGCSVTSLPDMVWCSTNPPGSHLHYADLHRNGAVRLCDASPTDTCLQNAITHATVLRVGQQNERRGFRCISEQKGITCTVIAGTGKGKGKGKGFLINSAGVKRVGP